MTDLVAGGSRLTLARREGPAWAAVALANATREFPRLEPVLFEAREGSLPRPRLAHPSFYGSFDWHSAVEMHWVMARLLHLKLAGSCGPALADLLDRHLAPEAVEIEAGNLPRFECPYGYAWLLKLAEELELLEEPAYARWARALSPLAALAATALSRWLATSAYPVRHGLHQNTAFSCSLALGYARRHSAELETAIAEAVRRWFVGDRRCPAGYEPSGSDFLSPSLTEAALLAQLLAPEDFSAFLDGFLFDEAGELPSSLASPVVVSEGADWLGSHLHGLNLSRAHCLLQVAAALAPEDERRQQLEEAAGRSASASLGLVVGSDYVLEHWLVAYAVLYATEPP